MTRFQGSRWGADAAHRAERLADRAEHAAHRRRHPARCLDHERGGAGRLGALQPRRSSRGRRAGARSGSRSPSGSGTISVVIRLPSAMLLAGLADAHRDERRELVGERLAPRLEQPPQRPGGDRQDDVVDRRAGPAAPGRARLQRGERRRGEGDAPVAADLVVEEGRPDRVAGARQVEKALGGPQRRLRRRPDRAPGARRSAGGRRACGAASSTRSARTFVGRAAPAAPTPPRSGRGRSPSGRGRG